MATTEPKPSWPRMADPLPEHGPIPFPDDGYPWEEIHSYPEIDPTAWVAPGAIVLGRVKLLARSSVWFGCVLRGDREFIHVGEETNVQDGSILHVDPGFPCILGNRVTLGHRALVHASVVEDGALIAIGATVLSRCHIGAGAIVAAGAVVMEDTKVPPHTLWAGCPARQIRELDDAQQARLAHFYRHYVNNAAAYLARFGRAHINALCKEAHP